MEIRDLDLDDFGVRLFKKNSKYNNLEYTLVQSMDDIQKQFNKHFVRNEIYQFGWCVLQDKKRHTIEAFEKALRYHILVKELFIFRNHKEKNLVDDDEQKECLEVSQQQYDDEQDNIELNDILSTVEQFKPACRYALENYLQGYSYREIADGLQGKFGQYNNHHSVKALIEEAVNYASGI